MTASNILAKHDISMEEFRVYHYGDDILFINGPETLFIVQGSNGPSHRVVTKEGECYRPEPGYLAISWVQTNGEPFDF